MRLAPDVMVAFGRPKGDRGSHRQWVEGNVAPQVVFEVLSPGNRAGEMAKKLLFYEAHGVEEYYVFDPDRVTLVGYLRDTQSQFDEVPVMRGHVSPRLGVRFELDDDLVVYRPDGDRFLSYPELIELSEYRRDRAEAERDRAAALQRDNEVLRAKLRAAGIDPDAA